jgi:hypothetical protein
MPKASWDFYLDYQTGCLNEKKTPPTPVSPAPAGNSAPPPVSEPTSEAPTKDKKGGGKEYVPPEERGKKGGTPSKPYVPPDGRPARKSHFVRNLFIISVLGFAAYYYFKRRSDGFNFVRYRPVSTSYGGGIGSYFGNFFGGGGSPQWNAPGPYGFAQGPSEGLYHGLSMESSTSFEPPTLPPPPSSLNYNPNFQQSHF